MAQDPDVGTRNWNIFVKVENGVPQEVTLVPMTYLTSTGKRPTDEWLVENGYCGYEKPAKPPYDQYSQKLIVTPVNQLKIGANNVVVQTYTVKNLVGEELIEATEKLKKDINFERERRINGCIIMVDGTNIPIKGTPEDMRNLTNLGQLANLYIVTNNTTTIPFRDNNNVVHELTPLQMSTLWQKSVMYVSAVYQASWDLKESNPMPHDFANDLYWPNKEV